MSNDSEYVWTPLEDGYRWRGEKGEILDWWEGHLIVGIKPNSYGITPPEDVCLCQRTPAPPGGVPDALLQDAATRSLIVKGLERYRGDIQRAEASGWYDGFTVAQNEIARIDRTIDAILNATPAPPQPPYAIPPLSETIVTLHVENRGQGKPSGVLPQPLAPDQEGSS
jgi:hypothetical protein